MLNRHPMERFFNSRNQRTTTALVLFAWLFALASGIVNACSLEQAGGSHSHAAGSENSPHAHAVADLPEQTTDAADDTVQSASAKALCLDTCDDRTHSLPKEDASPGHPLLAPLALFAVVWIASQPVVSTVRLDRDNHADPFGIPIRVRYSRLTL